MDEHDDTLRMSEGEPHQENNLGGLCVSRADFWATMNEEVVEPWRLCAPVFCMLVTAAKNE